jgi:hypothetical protein
MKPLTRIIFVGVLVFVALTLIVIGTAMAAKHRGAITSEFYGMTADGQDVYEYT